MNILDFIAVPMGHFLNLIYNTVGFHSYGLAIVLFTLVVRFALMPLTIKQYKSMQKMQELQPQLQEIQRKYKNDKERLNEETLKLYQESKYNPAGGCLPLLIQLPILWPLYWVIQKPLTYMLDLGGRISELAAQYGIDPATVGVNRNIEIQIISKAPVTAPEYINMNFLGINLGQMPQLSEPNALWLFPILAALLTYFSQKLAMSQTTQTLDSDNPAAGMTKNMNTIFPFMTAYFAFVVPAGLGLYWIVGYVFQILQQLYLKRFVIKKKEVAKS